MKTESSHLQTCLAAAVAPSDAEPVSKMFSLRDVRVGKNLLFQPRAESLQIVGSHTPFP